MRIESEIERYFTEVELNILERYGDLLRSLADGSVSPKEKNQKRFVRNARTGFRIVEGASSAVWKKYLDLSMLSKKINSLAKKGKFLKEKVLLKDSQIEKLKSKNEHIISAIASLELALNVEKENARVTGHFANLLTKGIREVAKTSWDPEARKKLSRENRETLEKYGVVVALRDAKFISQEDFDEFSRESGLWIAIHNYMKIVNGSSDSTNFSFRTQHARAEICSACGSAVVNGFCKCSD